MEVMKAEKGITLVSLAITIIVLLMLVGVCLVIIDNIIVDKAVTASTKTIETVIQEQVELAWTDCDISYWNAKNDNPDIVREEYFKTKLLENLETLEDFKNITITGDINETAYVNLKYKKKEYKIMLSSKGKANVLYTLKGNVQIGDYIEYPVEYYDVYTGEYYNVATGWRVIDDGVMKGTSGSVRIISSGIPTKWYYNSLEHENVQAAIDSLVNNFENLDLSNTSADGIKGNCFKNESLAKKVTTLSLSDLNYAYNAKYETDRDVSETQALDENDDLFYIDTPVKYYWLATNNDRDIYYMSSQGITANSDLRIGIRPVICLKDELTGIFDSGVWKITN